VANIDALSEQGISQLYTGSLLSGAFSGLISAGVQQGMDGLAGLASWR
jgi:hypothetical protein